MIAIWCLLGTMAFSGALGGFIYTLNSPTSHTFRIPWMGEYDSGFLGHVIIGIGGALVAVAAAVPILDLNLNIFIGVTSKLGNPEPLIPGLFYIIAIGIIGGYSGLRIISGLSDAMLKKLQQEMAENMEETKRSLAKKEEEIQKLKQEVDNNFIEDQKRDSELKSALAKTELLQGNFLIFSGKPDQGVEKLLQYLKSNHEDAIAWSWLAMGYKRIGKIEEAVNAVCKAIELTPDKWVYHFNLACYYSMARKDLVLIKSSISKAIHTAADENDVKEIIESLTSDADFENILSLPEYRDFVSELKEEHSELDFSA